MAKTEWKCIVGDDGGVRILDIGNELIAFMVCGDENAHAERICLCVNGWDELEKQRDALLKALGIYGEHSINCQETSEEQYSEGLEPSCTCGLDKAISLCE